MDDPALAWRVEQACLNAWPALSQLLIGDWIARVGGGPSRRNNSANPLRPSAALTRGVIDACSGTYGRCRRPTIFRIPSILDPAADALLDRLGYRLEGDTLTLYGPARAIQRTPDPEVELAATPGRDWLAARARLVGLSNDEAMTFRRAMGLLATPAIFASLRVDGEIAALAYGATHDGLLCIEAVVTDVNRRRQGLGRRLLLTLLAAGITDGCDGVCLQVVADNTPAISLYRFLGLTRDLYRYHYRRAP